MTGEVKLWDQVGKLEPAEVKVWVVLRKSFEMVDGPLASDVVRNYNIANSDAFQHRRNDIVHVDVPRELSEPPR